MILFECVDKKGDLTIRGILCASIVEVSEMASSTGNCWVRYHDEMQPLPRSICVKGTVAEIVKQINWFLHK